MANLKNNKFSNNEETKTSVNTKKRYVVNVYFDSNDETILKRRAKEKGLSVSSYIKSLVKEDINK
ncbi:MAG: hypothetical protein ACI4PE_04005 [Bacilli bacterium]